MTTQVINVRHLEAHTNVVYIGRAGRGQDGYFGNPSKAGARCPQCGKIHAAPGETITCFRAYFLARLARDPEFKRRVLELKGKTLACFCKPRPCHGDVIATWLDTVGK